MDNVFPALIGSGAGAVFALIGKVLWDSYKGGQVERRSAYVTQEECRTTRKGCCIDQVKKDLAADHAIFKSSLETIGVRMASAEKRLDDGREDFKEIRVQIGQMNQTLASLASEFRSFFRQFRKEDKE